MVCVIPAAAFDSIRSHSLAEYPKECCGLLVGRDVPGDRAIDYAVATRNVDPGSEHRFTIAPADFLAAERSARARGLDVVGFYHSHPDAGAWPSSTDLAEAWPFYSYLIVAVRGGRVLEPRCWRLADDGFVEEPLEIASRSRGEER